MTRAPQMADPRRLDDLHVEWLRLSDQGMTPADIARQCGCAERQVIDLLASVENDLNLSDGVA